MRTDAFVGLATEYQRISLPVSVAPYLLSRQSLNYPAGRVSSHSRPSAGAPTSAREDVREPRGGHPG